MMDSISQKAKQWIDSGKDPRSAHWQAGIEAILETFSPYLIPGRLVPVQDLEKDDIPVFTAILETADLSPGLLAAFLPPFIANKIKPPESADELLRIDSEKNPSYKILVARLGGENRILCAEISPRAQRPGADIFQSGALLGSYDYGSFEECISGLTQTIRAHMWQKDKWTLDEYRRYTVNWFEKEIDLRKGTVRVEQNYSFLHSPSLIKANRIGAIFTLIQEVLIRQIHDEDGRLAEAVSALLNVSDKSTQITRITEFLEGSVVECLNIMRHLNIIQFSEFSDLESEQFKTEFSATIRALNNLIKTGQA